VPTIS